MSLGISVDEAAHRGIAKKTTLDGSTPWSRYARRILFEPSGILPPCGRVWWHGALGLTGRDEALRSLCTQIHHGHGVGWDNRQWNAPSAQKPIGHVAAIFCVAVALSSIVLT